MLISLVGDTHCFINRIDVGVRRAKKVLGLDVDLCLQVGDFGFYNDYGDWKAYRKGQYRFEVPTLAVHGNHENEESAREAMQPFGWLVPNFKCLYDGGEIFEFTDAKGEVIRILGVGGARCVDNPPRSQYYEFNEYDYETAYDIWVKAGKPEIDILMTHDCPYGVDLFGDPVISEMFGLDPNKQMGERKLNELWHAVRPKLQINGHHHRKHRYTSPAGLKHMTLPITPHGVILLDTSDWSIKEYAI